MLVKRSFGCSIRVIVHIPLNPKHIYPHIGNIRQNKSQNAYNINKHSQIWIIILTNSQLWIIIQIYSKTIQKIPNGRRRKKVAYGTDERRIREIRNVISENDKAVFF